MRTIEIRVIVNLEEVVVIRDGNSERTYSGRQLSAAKTIREAIPNKIHAIGVIKSLGALDLHGAKMLYDASIEVTVKTPYATNS